MFVSYEWCDECHGWKVVYKWPDYLWGTSGTSTSPPCSCIPDKTHEKLLEESISGYSDIWDSLAKK